MDDFNLANGNLIAKKCENGHIRLSVGVCGVILDKKRTEDLRDWLGEALKKPRYEVKSYPYLDADKISYYYVYDNESSRRGTVAHFYTETKLNAKAEAERLCKRLNEGC